MAQAGVAGDYYADRQYRGLVYATHPLQSLDAEITFYFASMCHCAALHMAIITCNLYLHISPALRKSKKAAFSLGRMFSHFVGIFV